MTDTKPPSRTADQFIVRFPEGMRDRIAEAAKANNRSMNAEIVSRLERSFPLASQAEKTFKPDEFLTHLQSTENPEAIAQIFEMMAKFLKKR